MINWRRRDMVKFIKVPVLFGTGDDEERERCENLGIPYKEGSKKGEMWLNPSQLICYNAADNGKAVVELPNGYRQQLQMKFTDFVELLNKAGYEAIE